MRRGREYSPAAALLAGLGIALCLAMPARAQGFNEQIGGMISDEAADSAIRYALDNIHIALCEDDRNCTATTEAERADPPIETVDARAAMVFGVKSALASWCGLDFKRSFLPLMAFARHGKKFTNRQAALMAMIHGGFMQRQLQSYQANGGACPDTLKVQLDSQLPKLPPQ